MQHGGPRACATRILPAPSAPPLRRLVAPAALSITALLGPAALGAQGVIGQADECYGFAFGRWDPPLDMRAAGHRVPSSDGLAFAPGGRDWAAAVATGRDTTLLLFPAWWPAGVAIRFAAGGRTPTDTVRGRATALVADGRVRNPQAEVLAWPVSCGGTAPDRESGRALPSRTDTRTDRRTDRRTDTRPDTHRDTTAAVRGDSLRGRDRPRPLAPPGPARDPRDDGSGSR